VLSPSAWIDEVRMIGIGRSEASSAVADVEGRGVGRPVDPRQVDNCLGARDRVTEIRLGRIDLDGRDLEASELLETKAEIRADKTAGAGHHDTHYSSPFGRSPARMRLM
jgi:hypothetical protein